MELWLHNALTRKKEVLKPLKRRNVRMYVCGPTVYDFAHIGNARPVIVFDVLFRLLRHLYGAEHVTYVRNITDVDDKINARAAQEYPELPLNQAIRAVTEKTEQQFHADVDALGCLRPTVEPRATEHIEEMKEIIELLVKGKRAYVLDDHVLFLVKGLQSYGGLSHRSLEDMRSTARGEIAPKRNPTDFVLWKPSKPGEPAWPSPAGIQVPGRPGWHIECSAMSWKYLEKRFDIHGGGIDLLFPHHENERAQSCRAFNTHKMAQIWMHNGFLQVEGEKMSKSLGNFVTIRELLQNWKGIGWPGEALRFNMLRTHYRQPIDWTSEGLDESHKILWDWYGDLEDVSADARPPSSVLDALCDDLNTPRLITELHKLRNSGDHSALLSAIHLLGFSGRRTALARQHHVSVTLRGESNLDASVTVEKNANVITGVASSIGGDSETPNAEGDRKLRIEALVKERDAARKEKNFKESDRIRDELAAMGVTLKDSKEGTTWEVAR
jgi:cysteinyl-tRNA synthetase